MAGSRNIKGITIEIDGNTTKLVDSLKAVNNSIRDTQAALKDVNNLLKLDPGNTDLLRQKQEYLNQAITDTETKLQQEKAALEQLKSSDAFDATSEEAKALERQIAADEQALKNLKQEAQDFGSVAKQQFIAAGQSIQEFGGKVERAGRAFVPVSAAATAVGGVAVKSFAEVDKTMQLTNATMGNTEAQAKLLNDAMKEAAANSTFGMTDAATATLNFARAGLDAEQAAAALAPAMNLAAGEGGNLDTVSGGLVATINGFQGSFDDAAHYADVFAAACNNSALDVDSLSEAMSVAAPIFSAAGYAVEDAALFMGVMANNGIEADKAANSLKTGLARLVSPASEGATKMEELGISIVNADGSMKDSVAIQEELHEAFSQLSEAEQIAAASAIFGKNQMAPWLALINTAPADVDALSEALTNSEGVTRSMAEAMMSGFGGSIEQLKSSIDVAVTSLGEALAPTLSAIGVHLQNAVNWFNWLDESQKQLIAQILLVVAAIAPVLIIGGKLISGIGLVVQGIGSVVGILPALLSPIGLVVAAVAGLIAIFTHLYQSNETFRTKVNEVWEAIQEKISGIISAIQNLITVFIEVVKAIWAQWGDEILAVASFIWDAIALYIDTVLGAIQTTIQVITQLIQGDWEGAWNTIKTFVTDTMENIWSVVGDKVTAVKDTIVEKVGEAVTFLSDLPGKALQWGKDLIDNFISGIRDTWDGLKNTVSDVAEGIADFIGFSEPKKGPLSNFHTYAPDMMELYAQGIRDNMYLVTDQMNALAGQLGASAQSMASFAITNNVVLDGQVISSYVNRQLGEAL